MINIYLDVETYCDLDIKKVGAYRYVIHPSFEILCYSYAFGMGEIRRWENGAVVSPVLGAAIKDGNLIRAWNAPFERLVISQKPWLFGIDFRPPLTQYQCDMALAASFGYPLDLDSAAPAMGLDIVKDKAGHTVMMKVSRPRKHSVHKRWTLENAYDDFQILYKYCDQDVNTQRAVHLALPEQELPPFEQKVWIHTQLQNDRGLTIDVPAVHKINKAIDKYKGKRNADLSNVTSDTIMAATQRDRILQYVNAFNIGLPDLTADTVGSYLKLYGTMDHPAIETLKIRQQLSRTSCAKYKKLLDMLDEYGVVRGNLQYYGAIRTGRFAGRMFQVHNLPRRTAKDPEETLRTIEFSGDPMADGKSLLRSMIIAPPGAELVVADYSSIENRVLHWYARDHRTLQDFRNGLCQYRAYGAARFGIPYNQITDEQRTAMKPVVLALGFKGWITALISQAENYGIELSEDDALAECKFYRNKYLEVVALWEGWETAAISAVTSQAVNRQYEYAGIIFQLIADCLYVRLPSGRLLAYPNPRYMKVTRYWGPEGGLSPQKYHELSELEKLDYRKSTKYTIVFKGIYNYQWCDRILTANVLTNNIVQGTARDILCIGAINVELEGYPVMATIHDEAVASAPIGMGNLGIFNAAMCRMPKEYEGLPLAADGYIAPRYKKG